MSLKIGMVTIEPTGSSIYSWLALLGLLLALQTPGTFPEDATCDFPPNYLFEDSEEFEYVVVGAGAAGSAAAARLALAGARTLLVEAGGDPSPLAAVPRAAQGLLGSSIDWQYETISNNVSCLGSIEGACRFARGKCLGGSTSINYMMYTRGNRQDYDDQGVPGWTWRDLRPYFLRYEGFQDIERLPSSSLPYHNTSGILKVGFFDDPENPWHSRIVEGFRSLGFQYNPDVNAATQIGVSRIYGYVYDGQRSSTACAYLADEEVKARLKVAKRTLCTGLIIDENNVVTGITVVRGPFDTPMRIYATKEVILSAGSIGTPQILMLSGIGHAEHLRKMGIRVRADLPVGDNMTDHVLPLIGVLVDGQTNLLEDVVSLLESAGDLAQFLVSMGGPLASNGLTDITSFWNTKCYRNKKLRTGPGCDLPTAQMIHSYIDKGLLVIGKPFFQKATHFNDDVIDQLAAANSERALIVFSPVLLRPESSGTVRLASADPLDPPAIFPNFMDDPRDVDEMMRAIKVLEDLVETPDFKADNATILRLDFPDCPRDKHSIAYWRCYARHMTFAVFHSVGTCALRSVVDARLRVRGVHRVRVADLSVLRVIPRGNTEAAAVAIGEKVVDLLRRDHPIKYRKCKKTKKCNENDDSSDSSSSSSSSSADDSGCHHDETHERLATLVGL